MRNKLSAAIMAICASACVSTSVFAEEGLYLEEVIVTANKRAESAQDVASTVNAISEDVLNQFEVRELTDIEALTAGLSLTKSTAGASKISLRGVTYDPRSNSSNAVQAYWNQVSVDTDVAFGQTFDVQRIEVLRGPQGTLQGNTSPGGAIQIHTRKANLDEMEGNVSLTGDDQKTRNFQYGVSLPLIEGELALRLAGVYDENNGSGTTSLVSGDSSLNHAKAQRATLNWQPSDDFSAQLVYQYGVADNDSMTIVAGSDELDHGYPTLTGADRNSMSEAFKNTLSRNRLGALTMDWQLLNHSFSSVTGHQLTMRNESGDTDIANILLDEITPSNVNSDQEVFSQEFRLASETDSDWQYMFGLYYGSRDTDARTETTSYVNLPDNFGGLINIVSNVNILSDSTQYGAFTHHKYTFNEKSDIQVGVRWQKVDKYNSGVVIVRGDTSSLLLPEDESNSEQAITGNINYSYFLEDEVMLYSRLARSFRPGGVTITPTHELGSDNLSFDSEDSLALEFGFKSRLFDDRLQLNGAIYQQEFNNYIARIGGLRWDSTGDGRVDSSDKGVAGGLNYNANTIIKGAELDVSALLSEDILAGIRVSYVDAKFDEGAQAPCVDADTINGDLLAFCDVSGQRVSGEPNWSLSSNVEYSHDMGEMDWYVRGLYKFSSARSNQVIENADTSSYGLLDLYTGLRSKAEGWDVTLWAKNVLDKQAEVSQGDVRRVNANGFVGAPSLSLVSGYHTLQMVRARSVGVTAKYQF